MFAAVGAFDALYSWRAAAQFTPGVMTRLRFVAYVAAAHAVAGGLVGVLCGGGFAALRPTRLGDMLQFGQRARGPDADHGASGIKLAIEGFDGIGRLLLSERDVNRR